MGGRGREVRWALEEGVDRRRGIAVCQGYAVAGRRQRATIVTQVSAGHRTKRCLPVMNQIFRAVVGEDARGRECFCLERREAFREPIVPAQRRELWNGLKGQLEFLRRKQADMSVRDRRTGSREQLRRRPTAGKRSSQAQPFGHHLLSYFCE